MTDNVTITPKWQRAPYFVKTYDVSRSFLLSLWRQGIIRIKKNSQSIQSGVWFNVADVDAYFNDSTPPPPPIEMIETGDMEVEEMIELSQKIKDRREQELKNGKKD